MLSALLGPLFELVRTARGQSSRARWLAVARQFALAAAMVVSIDATFRILLMIVSLPAANSIIALPLAPIAITVGVLTLLLVGAKAAQMAASTRQGEIAKRRLRHSGKEGRRGSPEKVAAETAAETT